MDSPSMNLCGFFSLWMPAAHSIHCCNEPNNIAGDIAIGAGAVIVVVYVLLLASRESFTSIAW